MKIIFTSDNPRVKIIYSPSGDYYRYEDKTKPPKDSFRYQNENGVPGHDLRKTINDEMMSRRSDYYSQEEFDKAVNSEYAQRTHFRNEG